MLIEFSPNGDFVWTVAKISVSERLDRYNLHEHLACWLTFLGW